MTRHNTGNNRASNRTVLRLRRSRDSDGREDTRSSTMPLLGSRQQSRLGRSDTITSRAGVESPTSESPGVTFLERNVRSTSPEQEGIQRCSTDDPLTTGQVVSIKHPSHHDTTNARFTQISIAASSDAQRAFEDSQGSSMTSVRTTGQSL